MPTVSARHISAAALVTLLAGAAVIVTIALFQGDDENPNELSPAEAAEFTDFPLYWVGETFEGMELAYISYDVTHGRFEEPGQNVVDIGYGSCDPPPLEGGCTLPLSIQIWPSCQRNPSMFSTDASHESEELTIRGAPAMFYDEGDDARRLEVFTDDITIVIWAHSNDQTLRAAEALHRIGETPGTAPESLPQPVPGALDGTGRCPTQSTSAGHD